MLKIDSTSLSPIVLRIFEAVVKKLETDELDQAHVVALRQADPLFQFHLHRASNANL